MVRPVTNDKYISWALENGIICVDAVAGVVWHAWVNGKKKPYVGTNGHGYIQCKLTITPGKRISLLVHRIVWVSMYGPIPYVLEINHKDGDRTNNSIANLELVTASQNTQHSYDILGNVAAFGEKCGASKLTEGQVKEIGRLYNTGNYSYREIGEIFGVAAGAIGKILNRRTWRRTGICKAVQRKGNAKITESQVEQIRLLGRSCKIGSIASKFGLSKGHIRDILSGKKWHEAALLHTSM